MIRAAKTTNFAQKFLLMGPLKRLFAVIFLLSGLFSGAIGQQASAFFQGIPFPYFDNLSVMNDSLWQEHFSLPELFFVESSAAPEKLPSSAIYGTEHLLSSDQIQPQALLRETADDWIIAVVILSLGLLSLARILYPHRTRQYMRATLGGHHFSQMEREGSFFDESPAWLLFVNFLLMLALLVYQTLLQTGLLNNMGKLSPAVIYLLVLGALAAYYPVKSMLTSYFAWVFRTRLANSAYTKNIFLFNILAGMLMLPLVVYNAYNPGLNGLFATWGLLVILNVAKVLRGASIGFSQAGFSVYYLILYLCAIELAPLLILAKAAGNLLLPV